MKLLRPLLVILMIFVGFHGPNCQGLADDQPLNSPQIPEFEGPITSGHVRPHVEFLASPALEGRGSTRSKRLAADYLKKHYESQGLKPLFAGNSFFQDIPGKKAKDGRPTIRGQNVGAWLPGSDAELRDEFVIVSAHYDHLGIRNGKIYPGADDNASGVAMVLEVARQMAERSVAPRRSMVFINFDLEENLLWGSRWFVAHPPWPIERAKLFITADLIGRSLGDLPTRSVFAIGSEYSPGLQDVLEAVGRPSGIHVDRLGVDLIGTRSDYGPFRSKRIPFLFFSTGEHPDYHTPRDTVDRIDFEKLAGISSLIYRVCLRITEESEPPRWSPHPKPDIAEVRSLHRITKLLLDADTDKSRKLAGFQRFLVSNMHNKLGKILAGGKIRPDERPWLIRTSQFLLLTVF